MREWVPELEQWATYIDCPKCGRSILDGKECDCKEEGMKAYVYKASLLCEECGQAVIENLKAKQRAQGPGESWAATNTGDSGDWPQGPYANGGGPSDSPEHCDRCGDFLENPLTEDGRAYIRDEAGPGRVRDQWDAFYGIKRLDKEDEVEEN